MYKASSNTIAEESQTKLSDALFRLLETKPLGSIKITPLCELAGVSRNAFYRNFAVLEDIMRFRLDQECVRFLAQRPDNFQNLEEYFEYFFTFWLERKSLICTFVDNRCADILLEQLSVVVEHSMPLPPGMSDHTPMKGHVFLASGLTGMLYFYIQTKCDQSPRLISKWLYQNLRYGLGLTEQSFS